MKTSVIEVRDMLSVMSVAGVEERIGKVPGVESVTLNFAAGSATVRYDETRLDIVAIRSAVRQIGYEEAEVPDAASAGAGHEGHAVSGALRSPVTPAGEGPKNKAIPDAASAPTSSVGKSDGAVAPAAPATNAPPDGGKPAKS